MAAYSASCAEGYSEKALRAAAMFGLKVGGGRDRRVSRGRDAGRGARGRDTPSGESAPPRVLGELRRLIETRLRPGQIALISGPSGSGKSRLLTELERRGASCIIVKPDREPIVRRRSGGVAPRVVDLLPGSLESTLRTLAFAGLADARVFLRRPEELSDGERFRFALARAIANVRIGASSGQMPAARRERGGVRRRTPAGSLRPVTLIIDEFASTLDRPAALAVAATLRRWLDHLHAPPARLAAARDGAAPGVRIIAAAANDDVALALRPDLHIHIPLGILDAEPAVASAFARGRPRARRLRTHFRGGSA